MEMRDEDEGIEEWQNCSVLTCVKEREGEQREEEG
jgi:hypothetical protein